MKRWRAANILLYLACVLAGPLLAQDYTIRSISFGSASDISKEGNRILLTDWKTGKIMVRDVKSGSLQTLTRGGYPDYGMYARFSPDGKRVAYSWRVGGGHFDLRLAALDQSDPKVLLQGNSESYFVRDWSPDGKAILAQASGKLILVSVEDAKTRIVVEMPESSFGEIAQFSPNGELLAYDLVAPEITSPGDIRIYSLKDRRELVGILHPSSDRLFGWSPDGRWILFSSDRGGAEGLWTAPVNADGAGVPQRIYGPLGGRRPWSVGVTDDGAPVYSVRTSRNSLFLADYDAEKNVLGTAEEVVKNIDYGSGVDWSPDGRRLVYARDQLIIRSYPEGQEQGIDVGLRRFHERLPHWIGDEVILVGARPNGTQPGLVTVDVTNGEVVAVIEDREQGVVLYETAAPTGLAYFPRFQGGEGGELVEKDVRTGAERTILEFPAVESDRRPIRHLALSADGKGLAYIQRSRNGEQVADSLVLVEVAGGEPQTLLTADPSEVFYTPEFTPDGRFLLFGRGERPGPDSKLDIWRVRVSSRKAQPVSGSAFPGKALGGLSLRPDGKKIAFTLGWIRSEGVVDWAPEVTDEVRIVDGVGEWLATQWR